MHEMRFAPEIHEINYKGSKNPIASQTKGKRAGLRNRLEEKLDYLNSGQFGTLADNPNMMEGDPGMVIGNLEIGSGSFTENHD